MVSRIDSLFKKKININLEFVDIKAVLNEIGISYSESGKNVSKGWIGVNCPFPGCGDHSNHLGINLHSPVVTCYNCGNKGNYLTYLAVELKSWDKAVKILQKHTPRELQKHSDLELPENKITHVNLPSEATKTPSKQMIDYLKSRKYPNHKELELMYDFYYCSSGKWVDRIIVPIYYRNRLVTFTSVDTNPESKLRYKHASINDSIIQCKHLLYGLEQVTGRSIMVVEGFFDKLRIGPGCVCSFGTMTTHEQKMLLIKFQKIYVVFDGDNPGKVNGRKLANDLSAYTEVELITLPEGIDPDKLPDADVKELRNMVKTKW